MVRYTMDEWETVNDVLASYDGNRDGWDRFKFSISLGTQGLRERVVWLVGKYAGGAAEGASGDAVEWWDNNQGKNYRVAFKEEERVEYKRGVVVSAPSKFFSLVKRYALIDKTNIATYTSPAPISKPKLSDPEISSSIFAAQQSRYQLERERVQHQEAITQGTLARLKKLNLKNYAAPRGYTQSFSSSTNTTPSSSPTPKLTPPVLTITSASPTTTSFTRPFGSSSSRSPPNLSVNTSELSSPTFSTTTTGSASADSTPVQTPQGDESDGEESWIVGGGGNEEEERESLRWSLVMENGHFATTLIPSGNTSSSSPTTTPLGSPIPVSIPGDRNGFSYITKSAAGGGMEMGTSPPFSDLKESVVRRGGSVYWDWGTAAAGVAGDGKKESAFESMNLAGNGLTPPQRRRGLPQQKSGSSSSSSESDSDFSKNSKPTSTPTPPPATLTTVTPKPKSKPPILTLPTSTTTRPSVTSPSFVQSPNRYNSSQQPSRHGHRHYQSMPSSFIGKTRIPPGGGGGDSDAIYQALVREWCFAQGDSMTNTNATSSTSGETTPVLVVKNPGLTTCALGDGE